jgi:hypothetical protein
MKFLIAALLGFAIIGGACDAMADPVVVLSTPGSAEAVDGVFVGGTEYDVSFIANAIDPTFDGQSSLAAEAVSELDAALNGTTAYLVNLAGCCVINQFIVEDDGPYAGVNTTSYSSPGNWQVYSTTVTGDGSVAVFTAVPEPADIGWLTMGVSLALLAVRSGRSAAARGFVVFKEGLRF